MQELRRFLTSRSQRIAPSPATCQRPQIEGNLRSWIVTYITVPRGTGSGYWQGICSSDINGDVISSTADKDGADGPKTTPEIAEAS